MTHTTGLFLDRIEGNCETRALIPDISVRELIESGQKQLLNEKSEGRWNHLSSVYKQFLTWKETLGEDCPTEEWCVVCFLEAKQRTVHPQTQKPLISTQTAHTYAKSLIQIIFRTGGSMDATVVKSYMRALCRKGALIPEHQAPPAKREEIDEAYEWMLRQEGVGLLLAWKTCSRIDDVLHLRRKDLEIVNEEKRIISVIFPVHKGDPFRVGTAVPVKCNANEFRIFKTRMEALSLEKKIRILRQPEQTRS